jgi:hypothetical protein
MADFIFTPVNKLPKGYTMLSADFVCAEIKEKLASLQNYHTANYFVGYNSLIASSHIIGEYILITKS